MIVHALVKYYESLAKKDKAPMPGWCTEKVSYALSLAEDGRLIQVVPLLEQVERGNKKVDVPQEMIVPERVVRSSGVKPNFLCDNTSYFLGVDNKGKPARSRECFAACKELHENILETVNTPAARAIKAFFAAWEPEQAQEHPALEPFLEEMLTSNLVFVVMGAYAQNDAGIAAVWDTHYADDAEEEQIRCLITGENAPFARIHGKITLPGAQSSGASLISINAPAFESYGKAGGENSPTGKYAAFAYATALNYLLHDRAHRISMGGDTVVYWAENASEELQDAFLFAMQPEGDDGNTLNKIMKRTEQGGYSQDQELDTPFYILCLSPNAARISVRFFHQGSFGDILQNCRQHYAQLEIERPAFDKREYLSLYYLLQETVNQNSRDKSPTPLLGGAVLRSILLGGRYPQALYASTFSRIRAEQNITRGRAAIVKAYLLRNTSYTQKEGVSVALNTNATAPAYVLGRLFAMLENLQEQANPGINSTIKDKYFTSAGTTPANVFPTLLRLSKHHLAKLDQKNIVVYFEKQIGELLDKLTVENEHAPAAFPKHLNMNDQGLFVLGYYHQVQYRYRKKEEQ